MRRLPIQNPKTGSAEATRSPTFSTLAPVANPDREPAALVDESRLAALAAAAPDAGGAQGLGEIGVGNRRRVEIRKREIHLRAVIDVFARVDGYSTGSLAFHLPLHAAIRAGDPAAAQTADLALLERARNVLVSTLEAQ